MSAPMTSLVPLARLSGLVMLYGSRLAAAVVSLIFIPLYARLLGPHDFGVVALILSTQALMLMLDMGMSTLTTRDLAASPNDAATRHRWLQAERLLTVYFAVLLLPTLTVAWMLGQPVHLALVCVALFWTLTLQNLAQAAMVARGDVFRAAALQGAGVLLRAAGTAAVLLWLEPSLRAFVISQLVGALIHLAVNRRLGQPQTHGPSTEDTEDLIGLARRGLPLFLVGAAGAGVLHVDKLLVGAFISPLAVAPYFLATSFCLTPIGILAGPVVQFFQPLMIRAHASGDGAGLRRRTRQLTYALLVTVIGPTTALWFAREPVIGWWLGDHALASQVASMSALLLPAAAIGAVGNAPLALVTVRADFGFQARLSAVLTLLTLVAVALAAHQHQLLIICWIYIAYYLAATVGFWLRATTHASTAPPAKDFARLTLAAVALVMLPTALFMQWR